MKTLSQHITENEQDKVWAIYDRDEIFITYHYDKDEAQEEVDSMNNDTPSMKYHLKEINKSEVEKK